MPIGSTYARGHKAWGICQRCGLRALLNELVFDGYYRDLRVHRECRDDRHPQEFPPVIRDPVTLWKPSPEQPGIPPVLSGSLIIVPPVPAFDGTVLVTSSNIGGSGVSVGNDFSTNAPNDFEFMVDPLYSQWIASSPDISLISIQSDGGFYTLDDQDAADWFPPTGGSFPKPAFVICVYKNDVTIVFITSKLTILGRGGVGPSANIEGGPAIVLLDVRGHGLTGVDLQIVNQLDADQGTIVGGYGSSSTGKAVARYGCAGTTTVTSGMAGISGVIE